MPKNKKSKPSKEETNTTATKVEEQKTTQTNDNSNQDKVMKTQNNDAPQNATIKIEQASQNQSTETTLNSEQNQVVQNANNNNSDQTQSNIDQPSLTKQSPPVQEQVLNQPINQQSNNLSTNPNVQSEQKSPIFEEQIKEHTINQAEQHKITEIQKEQTPQIVKQNENVSESINQSQDKEQVKVEQKKQQIPPPLLQDKSQVFHSIISSGQQDDKIQSQQQLNTNSIQLQVASQKIEIQDLHNSQTAPKQQIRQKIVQHQQNQIQFVQSTQSHLSNDKQPQQSDLNQSQSINDHNESQRQKVEQVAQKQPQRLFQLVQSQQIQLIQSAQIGNTVQIKVSADISNNQQKDIKLSQSFSDLNFNNSQHSQAKQPVVNQQITQQVTLNSAPQQIQPVQNNLPENVPEKEQKNEEKVQSQLKSNNFERQSTTFQQQKVQSNNNQNLQQNVTQSQLIVQKRSFIQNNHENLTVVQHAAPLQEKINSIVVQEVKPVIPVIIQPSIQKQRIEIVNNQRQSKPLIKQEKIQDETKKIKQSKNNKKDDQSQGKSNGLLFTGISVVVAIGLAVVYFLKKK